MKPELLQASTYHKRIGGPDNAFRYSVDYVLSEPEKDAQLPVLLSRNGYNIASINDRDHGGLRKAGQGAAWVREVLQDHGLEPLFDCRILLLAQPRMMGYLFNPVSFWLIVDAQDQLRAFIAEVNNTFGDRHSYLCSHDDLRPITADDTIDARKLLHVSPFQKVAGHYRFRIDYTQSHIGIRIGFTDGEKGLVATLSGKRQPLNSIAIVSSLLRRPLGSARVVALIYWQALVLFLKGAQYRARPLPPSTEVSR